MNPLLKALSQGYTANQILSFLSSKSPGVGDIVQKARGVGHKPKNILNYFVSALDTGYDPEETAYESSDSLGRSRNRKLMLGLGAMGGLAAYALKRAAPAVAGRALAQQAGQQATQAPPSAPATNPAIAGATAVPPPVNQPQAQQPILGQPAAQPQAGNVNQAAAAAPVMPKLNATQLFKNLGIDKQAKNLTDTQSPEIAAKILEHNFLTPEQKKSIKQTTDQSLEELVTQFLQENSSYPGPDVAASTAPPEQKPEQTPELENPLSTPVEEKIEQPLPDSTKPEAAEQDKPKVIKGATVITNDGKLGAVLDIRNGIASFKRGKETHHRAVKDIFAEPEEIKKAQIVFDPTTVLEADRSAALGWVMSPTSKMDVNIMYGPSGDFVRYTRKDGKPIGEDELKKLKEGMIAPATDGDTYMGMFDSKIADSRGSHAVHEFKMRAQNKYPEKPEEDDSSKPYWVEPMDKDFIHGIIEGLLGVLKKNVSKHGKAKTLEKKVKKYAEEKGISLGVS